jgi:uncharacterized protein (TIGR00730 family)
MFRICVYCGSSEGTDPVFRSAALELGQKLAALGVGLVYGGGGSGLMGAVADAVMEGGGEVIGIIPKLLIEREHEHRGLTHLHEVETMHQRKQRMADLSDAYIALPGGIGTLEELIEIFTWQQLGYHEKPVAILNVEGFYDPLLAFLSQMVEKGFMTEATASMLIIETETGRLLDRILHQTGKQIEQESRAGS